MPISVGDKANFETLLEAVLDGDVALLECQLVITGQPATVICALNREPNQSLAFVPIAQLFAGDPYSLLHPPHPDRPGFASQDEVQQQ